MARYDAHGRLVIPEPRFEGLFGGRGQRALRPSDDLLTQVYCPRGHSLITPENRKFGGRPGIALVGRCGDVEGQVVLSPFRGDSRKEFQVDFEAGAVVRILCPVCREALPVLAPHPCTPGASYVAMFLTRAADLTDVVAVCNAWGCPSSFLRRGGEAIAETQAQIVPEPALRRFVRSPRERGQRGARH